jgi:hypothetical protein
MGKRLIAVAVVASLAAQAGCAYGDGPQVRMPEPIASSETAAVITIAAVVGLVALALLVPHQPAPKRHPDPVSKRGSGR